MDNFNLTKVYKEYYSARLKPSCFPAGEGRFITVVGRGEPGGDDFQEKVSALYQTGYGIRAKYKSEDRAFTMAKLEGFWWSDNDDEGEAFLAIPRSEWNWKLLIRLPDFVSLADVEAFKKQGHKKITRTVPAIEGELIDQGTSAHILHKGPFSEESKTLDVLDRFLETNDFKKIGRHHEIYLSDFRRTDPEKLKTILMYQVQPLQRIEGNE